MNTHAAVPGYIVGGKTGTAQVVGPNGRYLLHTNNASFMAAFPMQDPQYVVYVLVLQPKPTAKTYGFTTGGFIAAPTVGQIIARIGPMLGILPESGDKLAALQASLTIPMQPTPPPGVLGLGPDIRFRPARMPMPISWWVRNRLGMRRRATRRRPCSQPRMAGGGAITG